MFFDNASTTKLDEKILNNFTKLNDDFFYNPGGLYQGGRVAKKFINDCKIMILEKLKASDGRLIFTGSATEANNLALVGLVKKNTRKILISMGEHPSVYNVGLELKNRGYNVEFVNLDKSGKVNIDDFKSKMTSDVDIVSIIHVSNETGAINDINALCEYAKEINPKVIFHSDGVQAVGKIDVDLDELNVDLYTMSAHKIGGMKGVGALYIKNGINIKPLIFGGGQEDGLRSGTENLLGIYSLSESVKNRCDALDKNFKYVNDLKYKFLNGLSNSNLKYSLHSFDENSPYIVSLSFEGCRAETILNMLSDRNIFIGNGSACSSKKSGNRILDGMGVSKSEIEGNLRISFGINNTLAEVDELIKNLVEVVKIYREKV